MAPTLVTITGSIYDAATGLKRTSGRLLVAPRDFIVNVNGVDLVGATPVVVNVPASGNLSFQLSPSNGVNYGVEFDPDPSSVLPRRMRPGYFSTVWTVPVAGPVDLSTL